MSQHRSASANDVEVAIRVLGRYGDLEYRDAVALVAEERNYTKQAVYGIVNRARDDQRTVAGVAALRQEGASENSVPQDVIPDGFRVKGVSSLVDDAGDLQQQWIQATPISSKTVDLQDAIPAGHRVRGVSTYVDERGNVRGQWIKTDTEKQRWLDVINALLDSIPQRIEARSTVARVESDHYLGDMLTVYPIADLHIGLYSTALDAERDWRLDSAKESVRRCMEDIISRTPPTRHAIIANLGDFTHNDNATNRTPRSGAALDVDGRYIEIVQAAMELAVDIIDLAASHHQHVTVVWMAGNHDEATAIVLQTALATLFRHDARVEIVKSAKWTHCIQWGKNALGFTHGDTIKPGNLPLLMATDYPQIWATTTSRVWHTGHVHHRKVEEFPGCTVESHQSPTPRDAWHDQQGYRSLHSMCSIVYDQQGEYARNVVWINAAAAATESA